MTGLIPEKGTSVHEREFSRKTFLKGGGALVVGVTVLGAVAGKASAANGLTPFSQRGPSDYLPDINAVDTWITITPDNRCIITHGETELGHGTPTGITMLIAEELNMDFSQMTYAHPESWLNVTGGGSGSSGISSRSTSARAAAAYAKQILLGMASTKLNVPVANLSVTSGVISGGGQTVKYGDLIGGKLFNYTMSTDNGGQISATPGQGIAKPVSQYAVVGKSFPRIDIPAKVNGTYTYIQNVRIPGMLHGRRVRPRGAGANTALNDRPVSVDPTSISHIPGAQVVQVGNWLGVVAPKEYDAIQAAAQLKVVWQSDPKLSGSGNFWGWVRKAGDSDAQSPARFTALTGNVDSNMAAAAKTVSATYRYHYNSFMPIGPHCAVADVDLKNNRATVYVQAQALTGLPANLAGVVNSMTGNTGSAAMPTANCRVVWYEGASSFGGGQTGEVNEEAVILSTKLGVPVRVQWMRWDQHGWDHFGVANMWDVKMASDAKGNIVAADWTTYAQSQSNIDQTKLLAGNMNTTWPATPGLGGLTPPDAGLYANTNRRVLAKTQPLYGAAGGGSFKCNFLRAPNAPQQFFGGEQIVDELAYAMKMDPVQFRRQNIDGTQTAGARWLAVLDGATIAAGWKPKVANSKAGTGDVRTGRGFSFGTFASSQVGVVADIQVNMKSGRIWAQHLYIAQNNGVTIGPQLVANQMSGAAVQGLSRAIWEQPVFTKERITSLDWVTYPILRFKDAPAVTLVNVHPGEYVTVNPDFSTGGDKIDVSKGNTNAFANGWTLTGSGEPPTAAVGAAVANAFFDATGVRIRLAPMNPSNVRATLKAAGK